MKLSIQAAGSAAPSDTSALPGGSDALTAAGRIGVARPGRDIASVRIALGDGGEALRSLATATGAAPLAVAAALWAALLYRHSQQSELPVALLQDAGDGVASRAAMVTVLLSDDGPLSGLVRQLQQALDAPGGAGDGHAGPPAKLLVTWSAAASRAAGLAAESESELCASFIDDGRQLLLDLHHDARLSGSVRLRELGAQFGLLACQAATQPQAAILEPGLLTEFGRSIVPDAQAAITMPRHAPITEVFAQWALRTPQAVAIRSRGQDFSYAQLDDYSRSVAAELCRRGIVPQAVVAVGGVRSFALVGAMLGVLRSGAALLTLDPKLPVERRRSMVQQADARIRLRVAGAHEADDLADAAPLTLRIDAHSHCIDGAAHGSAGVALPRIEPEQAAYVFFTSGSTGVPKGVKGRHAGLAHFLDFQRSEFKVGPGDRASQLTALSFDVVLRDMFLALTSGATLCIPAEDDVLDPAKVLTWLEREAITTVHVVPSLARMWLNHVPPGVSLAALRRVFFAGEPLTDVLVGRWRAAFPGDFEVVNLYGPTETTLAKCFYRVPAEPDPGVQPIGRTFPQTQALILNRRKRVCGVLEIGEIAIRTPFRTLGYVNNAEANAKAFIRNPFRDDPDDLVYLTGDSGRYRLDGKLEILGRIDNQVKIRGVRIEPGEIEACFARHPAVREVAVVARDDGSGEKMLVAYVVAKDQPAADVAGRVASYRQFLRERLPDNMVPAAFVLLDALPLNANGKVDKKALPAPDRSALAVAGGVEPRNSLERQLASVWRSVLKLERVGIDDNFFDIGGHSLLAVQLARAVEKALDRACPLPAIFRAPTIRALGEALEQGGESQGAAVLPLQTRGSGPALFCICGVHLYQQLADRLAPDVPVYGIFLPYEQTLFEMGEEGLARFPSVEKMAADYVAAMRQQQPAGPYCLAGVSFGGVLAYEMAQQLRRAGEEVEVLAMLDTMLPDALRRHWWRWALEHARQVKQGGWRVLLGKLRWRLARWRSAKAPLTPQVVPEAESQVSEAQRLGELRETIYKRATRAYELRPFDSEAILLRAEDKRFFQSDVSDMSYGWGELVSALRIYDVPGDHLGILQEPNVGVLVQHLRQHLDRARHQAAEAA